MSFYNISVIIYINIQMIDDVWIILIHKYNLNLTVYGNMIEIITITITIKTIESL